MFQECILVREYEPYFDQPRYRTVEYMHNIERSVNPTMWLVHMSTNGVPLIGPFQNINT